MGDPLRAPKVIRLNDLHQPDILPVIRLPVPPPPPRGLHDEAKTESLVDKTTTATLDAVIKLLNQAGAETAKL